MFGDMASDALGTSEICEVIDPSNYSDTIADAFVLKEDGEKIHFLLKSKEDEYCFTNYALLQVEGETATGGERSLRRYEYHENPISNVTLETAGSTEMEVELMFNLGETAMEIDVDDDHLPKLTPLYKALVDLSVQMEKRRQKLEDRRASLEKASSLLKTRERGRSETSEKKSEALKEIHSYIQGWMSESHEEFWREDFGPVFEKYAQ